MVDIELEICERCVCRLLFWSTGVLAGFGRMLGCWSAKNVSDDEAKLFC
jgi:hypothetical protein